MAITEEVRHQIYEVFRASFGDEVANGLMEMLPPVGWADVATKHDLAGLEERMNLRFGALEERFDARFELVRTEFALVRHEVGEHVAGLRAEMQRELRDQTSRFIGWMFAAVGISSTIAGGFAALS